MEGFSLEMREEILDTIADYIKANLRVETTLHKSQAYYDTDSLKTRVYLGNDLISETESYPNL